MNHAPDVERFAWHAGEGGDKPQARALAYSDTRPGTRCWATEEPRRDALTTGTHKSTRNYVVGTFDALERAYAATPAERRRMCEIVRAGHPCHLYLDIEAPLNAATASVRPSLALPRILTELACELERVYAIERSRVDFRVLDSSVRSKFSVHVVAHIDGGRTVFADGPSLKPLIDALAARLLAEDVERGARAHDAASWYAANGAPRSCIDTSVYSLNRLLRLYGSSKLADPERVLRVAPARVLTSRAACGDGEPPLDDAELAPYRRRIADVYVAEACALAARPLRYSRATLEATMCTLVDVERVERVLEAPSTSRPATASPRPPSAPPPLPLARSTGALDAATRSRPRASATSGGGGTWGALPLALVELGERALEAHYGRRVALALGASAYNASTHAVRVRGADERYCPAVARDHTSNAGALVIDLRARRMRHLCYSPGCAATHFEYVRAPAALDALFDAYAAATPALHTASAAVLGVLSRRRRKRARSTE